MPPQIILASASPRRRALLRQLGLDCIVMPQAIDETRQAGEAVTGYVARLARAKAEAGWESSPQQLPVLGADTIVCLGEEHLGKPVDRQQAVAMLQQLAGRSHRVLTAISLIHDAGHVSALSESEVSFRAISVSESEAYWTTGEPADKAGGYAIQGLGAIFVAQLQGSYSGVMGLPLFETAGLLKDAGIPVLATAAR